MFEKTNYDTILHPFQPHGSSYSSNALRQMVLNCLKKRAAEFTMCVDSNKDFWVGKDTRKISSVWKLFMLVVVGVCGIYVCMVGVDRRHTYPQLQQDLFWKDWNQGNYSCPRHISSLDFPQHHPRPVTFDRQECACTPVHYFVILSMQRSGSGWFETLLNNHPNISSHGEIFSLKSRRENFSTIAETLDAVYNLDWHSSAAKNECTAAVGLKWMLNQGAMEYNREVGGYFQRQGVSVILLLRRNMLKRFISILANAYDRQAKPLNGTHKSHVHSKEEAKTLAEYRPTINIQHLPRNLQRVQEIASDAQHFFNITRLALVFYEDLMKNPRSMEEVQAFLGVEPRKLESRQVKIHTRPLKEQIMNWDGVWTRLKGTKFESFLKDEDYST